MWNWSDSPVLTPLSPLELKRAAVWGWYGTRMLSSLPLKSAESNQKHFNSIRSAFAGQTGCWTMLWENSCTAQLTCSLESVNIAEFSHHFSVGCSSHRLCSVFILHMCTSFIYGILTDVFWYNILWNTSLGKNSPIFVGEKKSSDVHLLYQVMSWFRKKLFCQLPKHNAALMLHAKMILLLWI